MKTRSHLSKTVLKILFFVGFLLITNSFLFGQEVLENAKISLTFSNKNDMKTIVATVTNVEGLPIEELDLFFYVKRSFSLLPIGDVFNTTDENGMVEVIFPNDLPGDTLGNVKLVVKILESDIYKDLEIKETLDWGVPTIINHSKEKRSLWSASSNAPISLIITVSSMIIVIWYIIFYIIIKLYFISKIG
ncbi:MAG: hypothetical protein L3J34_09410 [Flavobacteriaceae bacterium]|nr:hypothetical protein [Flavobacteriaceae bacterium]